MSEVYIVIAGNERYGRSKPTVWSTRALATEVGVPEATEEYVRRLGAGSSVVTLRSSEPDEIYYQGDFLSVYVWRLPVLTERDKR